MFERGVDKANRILYNIIMDKIFCENLKSARKGVGFTQKQVAEKLGVVESCYANWEQGRTEPNVDMLRKLAEIFDISIDELIK
ncbi:MAG: helix-turn-helix transcriptional regulator [Clostridiales bacterium]|nr:helix-turn-helix transcriptional regulator [Clostridiales bacterium]